MNNETGQLTKEEYQTVRITLLYILELVARELGEKDVRDITIVYAANNNVMFKVSNRTENFQFDTQNLFQLCEKLLCRNFVPQINTFLHHDKINLVAELFLLLRKMASKVKQRPLENVWLSYHSVFGYYLFDDSKCILKFTHEQFLAYCNAGRG